VSESLGTPGWAREVLGQSVARHGFFPGRKNARTTLFSRKGDELPTLMMEFIPLVPFSSTYGGSFYLYFGLRVEDQRDGYPRAAFVHLLSLAQRKEFIVATCKIIRQIPDPGRNAFATLGTNSIFSWFTRDDLDAWCEFIERALPVVSKRAELGEPLRGWLRPGPGPDTGPGLMDQGTLEAFAASVCERTDE